MLSDTTLTKVTSKLKIYFEELWSDEGFETILVSAKNLAEVLEIETHFEESTRIRPKKMKRQFSYESQDNPVVELN